MKKSILILIAFFLIHFNFLAQNWTINGNANADPAMGEFFGTQNNLSIAFRTNNTERMRLFQDGNANIAG